MKICVINSLYTPYRRGGAEVIAEQEVDRLKSAGQDVFVITIKPWSGWKSLQPTVEEIGGVRVYRFYPLNLFSFINIDKWSLIFRLKWLFWDIFNLHSYFVVKSILKREKPGEVHTHNLKGIGYTVWRAIKSLEIKNIHTLHDVQLVVPSGLLLFGREEVVNSVFYRLYGAICRWLVGSPDEVISPSQWLMDFYTQKGFFKASKKAVNLAFGALPEAKQLDLKPSGEVIKLLYVGQIEEHKGIVWLVETLKELRINNYELRIVGDGTKLGLVNDLVTGDERFKVYGRVDGAARDELIRQANFVVVPSLVYENSPTIIPIALALGVPVIAAKIGGISEMIRQGVNGQLFAPRDAEDFRQKTLRF